MILYLSFRVEQIPGECAVCGFDALIRLTTNALGPDGVSGSEKVYCGRCEAERRRS